MGYDRCQKSGIARTEQSGIALIVDRVPGRRAADLNGPGITYGALRRRVKWFADSTLLRSQSVQYGRPSRAPALTLPRVKELCGSRRIGGHFNRETRRLSTLGRLLRARRGYDGSKDEGEQKS